MDTNSENQADLTTPEAVYELMASSQSREEWERNGEMVIAANDGYPDFWYKEIVLSGLMHTVTKDFDLDRPKLLKEDDLASPAYAVIPVHVTPESAIDDTFGGR